MHNVMEIANKATTAAGGFAIPIALPENVEIVEESCSDSSGSVLSKPKSSNEDYELELHLTKQDILSSSQEPLPERTVFLAVPGEARKDVLGGLSQSSAAKGMSARNIEPPKKKRRELSVSAESGRYSKKSSSKGDGSVPHKGKALSKHDEQIARDSANSQELASEQIVFLSDSGDAHQNGLGESSKLSKTKGIGGSVDSSFGKHSKKSSSKGTRSAPHKGKSLSTHDKKLVGSSSYFVDFKRDKAQLSQPYRVDDGRSAVRAMSMESVAPFPPRPNAVINTSSVNNAAKRAVSVESRIMDSRTSRLERYSPRNENKNGGDSGFKLRAPFKRDIGVRRDYESRRSSREDTREGRRDDPSRGGNYSSVRNCEDYERGYDRYFRTDMARYRSDYDDYYCGARGAGTGSYGRQQDSSFHEAYIYALGQVRRERDSRYLGNMGGYRERRK